MNASYFYGPFDTVRVAIRAGRKRRRKPALLPQKRERRELALFITHDDGHPPDGGDGGRGRCKRRLRAGTGPAPLQGLLQSQGAYLQLRGQAECEEPGLEFQSANADFPNATQGAPADWDLYV